MVHRRRLRSDLRKERESAGLTQRDVARAMDWSLSKLIRIEAGTVNITTNDLKVLLSHYRIADPARTEHLLGIARLARGRSPWSSYRDLVSPEFLSYLAYESAASVIRSYEPLFVPGLLQVEEYARTVISAVPGRDSETIDQLVDLRMERQESMSREDGPELNFVIDEAALHRVVGGPRVMRQQLVHINDAGRRANVSVSIVPYMHGMYRGLGVPFVLFEFPEAVDEDVLFIENPSGDTLRDSTPDDDQRNETASYLETFFQLEQISKQTEVSTFIDATLATLSDET